MDAVAGWIRDFFGLESGSSLVHGLVQAIAGFLGRTLFNAEHRLFWVYLVSFVALAALSFAIYYQRGPFRVRSFLKFCFPRAVYLHRSALVDYQVFIMNRAIAPLTGLLPVLGIATVAAVVNGQLVGTLGQRDPLFASGVWTNLAFTLGILLVTDLTIFLNHAAHHFVPVLWAFHRVHHSAEVLTPVTLYRNHPFYEVVKASIGGVIGGLFQGFVFYFFFGQVALGTFTTDVVRRFGVRPDAALGYSLGETASLFSLRRLTQY